MAKKLEKEKPSAEKIKEIIISLEQMGVNFSGEKTGQEYLAHELDVMEKVIPEFEEEFGITIAEENQGKFLTINGIFGYFGVKKPKCRKK